MGFLGSAGFEMSLVRRFVEHDLGLEVNDQQ
jgi:hypothetical protein